MDRPAISFGPFRLFVARRLLLEGDKPVRLGNRAFDILAALVERAGEIVGKEELIARVWPKTFVEEANLKIQVSALRRALGDGQDGRRFVATVPGRGYNFVAPINVAQSPHASIPQAIVHAGAHNLPHALTRMIGREETVAALVSRLASERLVTIVGPGGIGKTTVALAVAERLIASYEDGVWLVDLAPLSDPRLAPSAVATALGLGIRNENALPGLVAGLKDKRLLLVLDTCEHVLDAAAGLASALLSSAPQINILATSRERLDVACEGEYRLGPLGSPQRSSRLTAAEAAAFPAVQLFAERVTALIEDFALTDANAQSVVEICRKLDGLPLAIEFAAPRVAALGIEGLAARLDDNLPLLGARVRTGTPRHQTMRAVIDWSYSLLSRDERRFFEALGVFSGGLTAAAAAAVVLGNEKTDVNAIDRLAELLAKSLIVADVSGATLRFRLLDTTRAFAIEKLAASGETERIARGHAEYYRGLFERAESQAAARPRGKWLGDYARDIDNLRAALDWAFSARGDGSIAIALTAAAVPLWMHLSLFEECRSRAKQALETLRILGTSDRRQEMRLQAALGASTSQAPEMGAAFTKALDIAEGLDDADFQLRALAGLNFYHIGSGQYRAASPFAQRFHDLAARNSDLYDRLFGERLMGVTAHFLGDQISARRHLEHILTHYPAIDPRRNVVRFQTDLCVSTQVFVARVLWLQGFSERAARAVETSIAEARVARNGVSVCLALALAACPIALWTGDLASAARYARMLMDHSREHSLPLWREFGARFQKAIVIKGGDPYEVVEPNFSFRSLTGLTELAEALSSAGRIAEAFAMVETGIEQSDGGWITPELLRLKGELFLLQSAPAAAETVESLFRQALATARLQGALSWELRAATSLARLLRSQGRPAEAVACLQPIYERFTEGFGTADLSAARQVLNGGGEAERAVGGNLELGC
jgi:predicted ATPase/DNA-binding winged helix-turn-helix (wHTH) protein